jgi:hypothetical protein
VHTVHCYDGLASFLSVALLLLLHSLTSSCPSCCMPRSSLLQKARTIVIILETKAQTVLLNYCSSGGTTPSTGRSKMSTISSVRSMVLEVNALTTCSHALALITSKMLHCHLRPPAHEANVLDKLSPLGKPSVHWVVYRNTSPGCSPPRPGWVTTAKPRTGSTFKPNGNLYRTTTSSVGTDKILSTFNRALICDPDGGRSMVTSKVLLLPLPPPLFDVLGVVVLDNDSGSSTRRFLLLLAVDRDA